MQARGLATQVRLLRAAEAFFTRRGYDGTSMSDIAGRAGVGVGTLYHHFPDKRALLLALIDQRLSGVAEARRSDFPLAEVLGDDPRAAVERWLRRAYDRLRKRPSLYVVILRLSESDPEVRSRRERIDGLAIERLTGLLELGQRRGVFRRGDSARAAAFLIHHAVEATATQLLVREVPDPPPDAVLRELTQMICRYLLEREEA